MIEIREEVKEAWKLAMAVREAGLNVRSDLTVDLVLLADFARDQLAARLFEQHKTHDLSHWKAKAESMLRGESDG